jgi:excisionase family DNA binding protein
MGSKYLTVKQAAALLGVSTRAIYRYARRGLLQTKLEGRHTFISEEDLRLVKKGRHDALSSPVKRDIIAKLQAEVQTLKMQMSTVLRLLNVRHEPLNFTAPEYQNFYQTAEQLSMDGWSPHAEELWAEYFVRLSVEDLEGIEAATGDKHPWRPLLRLATTMYLSPYNKHLADMLASGRTNVQHVAGVWCVLHEESPRTFDLLQERDAAPLKKLIRRLQKSQT